jgi:16S rRNA (uracil1498-N3)-methyltransferase
MARVFVSPEALKGDRAILDADAHRHLVKVLRLTTGRSIRIFDGQGCEIAARIEAIGKATVEVSLGERRQLPSPVCSITLIQSLPRGEKMDLIVQKTTELGVARIIPVLSQHGMAKPPSGRTRRWQTIAEEAARQSGRADVPTVDEPTSLETVLERAQEKRDEDRFLLWEAERGQALSRMLSPDSKRVAVLVGPEGGFAPTEVEACTQAGFRRAGLGPRILRTETAAIVAVALAQAAAGGLE